MELEINGIKYQPKPTTSKSKNYANSKIMQMMAMMSIASMTNFPGSKTKTKTEIKIDIIREFELIQQKKSKLSSSQRDWVVWKFNKEFEPVKNI